MRFITKKSRMEIVYYYLGYRKIGFIKEKFLLFPLEIDGEIRCFEKVKIKYKIQRVKDFWDTVHYYWKPVKFID